MPGCIDRSADEKRLFYGQKEVSRTYDALRFGGPSGTRVNQRELSLVLSLLPPGGKVLDLGCGTGRLSLFLSTLGYEVVGLDSSAAMLTVAKRKAGSERVTWLQSNAFALPLASAGFDAVVALRLAFHFADLRPLLAAAAAVAKPAGTIIVDTCSWSPRTLGPIGGRTWGGRIFAHRPNTVRREAQELGLDVVEQRGCFLFSPYLYRVLPVSIQRVLERLETVVPTLCKARVFWRLRPRRVESRVGPQD